MRISINAVKKISKINNEIYFFYHKYYEKVRIYCQKRIIEELKNNDKNRKQCNDDRLHKRSTTKKQ